jgi:transposase-like protein
VRRDQERYHEGGMTALATRSGWRPGRRRVPFKRLRIIEALKAQGLSNREIARRLGVTENAIRQQVGPSPERSSQQQPLPFDTTQGNADQASVTPRMTSAASSAASVESTPATGTGQA